MAINEKRLKEFQQSIVDLQEQLSFEEYNLLVRAKVLDFILKSGDWRKMDRNEWRRVLKLFFHDEYVKYIGQMESKIDEALQVVNHYYEDIGPQVERNIERLLATEKALKSRIGKYEDSAVKYYARVMRQAASDNLSHQEVASRLKQKGGKIEFYADTLARTGIKGIARTAKAEKARLGEVFWQQYVGIIRPETRPFCEAMKGQTHHIKTIRQMRNGQIEPVINYCGGFNCHHDWEPDPFYKPPEDWEKKIKWQEMSIGKRRIKFTLAV